MTVDVSSDSRATQIRRCAGCGQPAVRCIHVTQHMYRGLIPSGRTYVHRCDGCGQQFETLSAYRLVRDGMLAGITPFLGLFLVAFAFGHAWYYGLVGALMLIFGCWWIFTTGKAFAAQMSNPPA